ncbi:hypothetical protein HSB1_19090 [Halogranum salarium B-1]|uniref:Uncharacterized protein n=1 Tax=Halogranum salarium B-1 TaxID=1210908 RepID=J3JG37_9EURY|nr:hypothetical protein HSB1_19090 [Halogranum salarium B-1]
MSEIDTEQELTRAEVASYLREFADQLDSKGLTREHTVRRLADRPTKRRVPPVPTRRMRTERPRRPASRRRSRQERRRPRRQTTTTTPPPTTLESTTA